MVLGTELKEIKIEKSFCYAQKYTVIHLCNTKTPEIYPIFICLCKSLSVLFLKLSLSHGSCLQYKAQFLLTFVQLQLFM